MLWSMSNKPSSNSITDTYMNITTIKKVKNNVFRMTKALSIQHRSTPSYRRMNSRRPTRRQIYLIKSFRTIIILYRRMTKANSQAPSSGKCSISSHSVSLKVGHKNRIAVVKSKKVTIRNLKRRQKWHLRLLPKLVILKIRLIRNKIKKRRKR